MKVLTLIGLGLFLGTACEQQSFEYTPQKKQLASTSSDAKTGEVNQRQPSDDIEEEMEAPEDSATEAPPANVALTQGDILASDKVVIVAMADSGTTAKYYSDIGRSAVTTQSAIAQAGYQLGGELTNGAPLQVKPGQTLIFCNHPQSVQTFRAHGGGGNAPFDHWPNDKVLQAGECFEANGDTVNNNVGNTPGSGFYNHNQGNGNAGTTAIYVSIIDEAAAQAVMQAQ